MSILKQPLLCGCFFFVKNKKYLKIFKLLLTFILFCCIIIVQNKTNTKHNDYNNPTTIKGREGVTMFTRKQMEKIKMEAIKSVLERAGINCELYDSLTLITSNAVVHLTDKGPKFYKVESIKDVTDVFVGKERTFCPNNDLLIDDPFNIPELIEKYI